MKTFSTLFAAMRAIGGRSLRIETKIDRLTQRMETMMRELLDKIASLKTAVDAERKARADDIAAAVAQAKAAWAQDDAAEHTAAMAALDDAIKGLSGPAPAFSPSGN